MNKLKDRDRLVIETAQYVEAPKFPKNILVEVANICNQRCIMCAYAKSTRAKGVIDKDVYRDVITQAYSLGAREIGLYSGAEPLMCKDLENHIRLAKVVGYRYVYVTTNGTAGSSVRIKKIIDAGLNSLKFSINAGDETTYRIIHGVDGFKRAISNLSWAHTYRESSNLKFYLSASFVVCGRNAHSLSRFRSIVGRYVDEIYVVKASNQSGQMPDLPPVDDAKPCPYPFNQVHISREGYLRLCCCDYQNFLAVEDLNKMYLEDAWNSDLFRKMRRAHIADRLSPYLCHNCLNGTKEKPEPVNPELSEAEPIC